MAKSIGDSFPLFSSDLQTVPAAFSMDLYPVQRQMFPEMAGFIYEGGYNLISINLF